MEYSESEIFIEYFANFWLTAVSVCKKCPHVQQTMPMFQYEKNAVHFILGSVSSNSPNSMLPTSWIIGFESGLTECGSPGIRNAMSASLTLVTHDSRHDQ